MSQDTFPLTAGPFTPVIPSGSQPTPNFTQPAASFVDTQSSDSLITNFVEDDIIQIVPVSTVGD